MERYEEQWLHHTYTQVRNAPTKVEKVDNEMERRGQGNQISQGYSLTLSVVRILKQ